MRHFVICITSALLFSACSTTTPLPPQADANTTKHTTAVPTQTLLHQEIKLSLDNYSGQRSSLIQVKTKIEQLIGEHPDFAPVYTQLARYILLSGKINHSSYQTGAVKAADKALQKSLKLDPKYANAYVMYGLVYRLMKKSKNARAALEMAEKLGTTNPYKHIYMADVLIVDGDPMGAAKQYEQFVATGSDNRQTLKQALQSLVRHYRTLGQMGKVSAMYQKLINTDPNQASVYASYANHLLYYVGDYEAAIKHSRLALEKFNYNSGKQVLAAALYRKWAHIYLELKKPREAQKYFDEANSMYSDTVKIAKDAARSPYTKLTLKAFRAKDLEAMNNALQGQKRSKR